MHACLVNSSAMLTTVTGTLNSNSPCRCDTLTTGGVVALVLLVLFFVPLACIPCCMAR